MRKMSLMFVVLLACSGRDGRTDEPGDCAADADCDDGIACTVDTCGVGGVCNRTVVGERCSDPTPVCDPDVGCVEEPGCSGRADCDDGVACTNDVCSAGLTCEHVPVDELCDAEAGEVCDATRGCLVPMPCATDEDCDDGDFCNGKERCDPEFGCGPPSMPRMCDDSDDCTVDRCDATANMCVFACDGTRPECECSTADATCDGRYSLPGASGSCLSGLLAWDFTDVTFTNLGGAIQVTGWTVTTTGDVPEMADPGPACPSIDASTTLPGDCDETYRIEGSFAEDGTFTGTFSATFTSFCAGCSTTVDVTGSPR